MADRSGRVIIGWVREDTAHDVAVKTLVARVVADEVPWFDPEQAPHLLAWVGLDGAPHLEVKACRHLQPRGPGGARLKLHGHIDGQRLEPEARQWRKALVAFAASDPQPHVVIIARDGDGHGAARRRGFEQVVEGLKWPFDVVLAMPEPEGEAWFIAGLVPADETERARLDALTRALSFDPTAQPHRLTSKPNDAPTDTKRVLKALTGDDPERNKACLLHPLPTLCDRGAEVGLARFVEDARAVVPRRIR